MFIDFHVIVPDSYIQNLVKNGPVVSKNFIFICKCSGAKVKNDLDLSNLDLLNNLSAYNNFQVTGFDIFWKSTVLIFFP